MITICS